MTDFNNPMCLLAIEDRPNSFIPIYLTDLGIDNCLSLWCTLKELDELFITYGADYFKNNIINSNILGERELIGEFVILVGDNKKRIKLPIIKKELYEKYHLPTYLSIFITNSDFKNHIINRILNMLIDYEIKKSLMIAIRNGDIDSFFLNYYTLPYFYQREIYFFLLETFKKFEQKDLLKKERKEA